MADNREASGSKQTFSVAFDDLGRHATGVVVDVDRHTLVFLTNAIPNARTIQLRGRAVGAVNHFNVTAKIMSALQVTIHGAKWIRVTCTIPRDSVVAPVKAAKPARSPAAIPDGPLPERKDHLRHTIQIKVADVLRGAGRLDDQRVGHAPLLGYMYVRSFEERGTLHDRYDCRTKVRRQGHIVDHRTLVDIGQDGTVRLSPGEKKRGEASA
jgi:hypothetical protein